MTLNPDTRNRLIALKLFIETANRQKAAYDFEIKRNIRKQYIIKQTIDDLTEFIEKNTPDMKNILMSYYDNEQNLITRKALSELMGFNVTATEYVKYFTANSEKLKSGLASSWLTAMKDQMKKISEIIENWLKTPYLAVANQRLLNYIDTEALQLAVSLANQRYLVLQDMLSFFAANDISLTQALPLMRQNMVLTPKMAEHVRKAYTRALNSGLTKKEALRIARAKSERLKDWRARTQIRTELTRAKGEADIEALRQGIERGLLENVYKTWIRTAYNDNWRSSIDNDGITVPLEGLWANGSFKPDEINERCIMNYMMVRKEN